MATGTAYGTTDGPGGPSVARQALRDVSPTQG